MFGFVNIFKKNGMTSHDVVSRLRRITGVRRIGHAGTLDPMAEGVLPVAIGSASRLIEYLTDEKVYVVDLRLGAVSDTCDIEGEVVEKDPRKVSESEFFSAIRKFRGDIVQIPPLYSAVHYNGRRLYELARAGEVPEDIPARKVRVDRLDIIAFDGYCAKLEIACSKGTYIRSIVRDIGEVLGTGAVMTSLLRKQSGLFKLLGSVSLEDLQTKEDVRRNFANVFEVLPYKRYLLSESDIKGFSNGVAIKNISEYSEGEIVLAVYRAGVVGVLQKTGSRLDVVKVFPIEELNV